MDTPHTLLYINVFLMFIGVFLFLFHNCITVYFELESARLGSLQLFRHTHSWAFGEGSQYGQLLYNTYKQCRSGRVAAWLLSNRWSKYHTVLSFQPTMHLLPTLPTYLPAYPPNYPTTHPSTSPPISPTTNSLTSTSPHTTRPAVRGGGEPHQRHLGDEQGHSGDH